MGQGSFPIARQSIQRGGPTTKQMAGGVVALRIFGAFRGDGRLGRGRGGGRITVWRPSGGRRKGEEEGVIFGNDFPTSHVELPAAEKVAGRTR